VFTVTWQTNESKAEDTRANILEAAEMDGIDGPCSSRPTPAYERACSDYLAFRDTAENHRNIALVVGALAVAAIGGTVAAYFVTSKQGTGYGRRPAPPRVSVLPELTPDRQGLQVVGHF